MQFTLVFNKTQKNIRTSRIKFGEFEIDLTHKKIRNLHLRICPPSGQIKISAPLRMKMETIRDFVFTKESWIRHHQERLRLSPPRIIQPVNKQLEKHYRKQLMEAIPALIKHYEPIMNVSVAEFRVKKMKTKWGTCNISARRIWLSLELAKHSRECLEYIVVHEMTHLLERRHNQRFKNLMTQFLPNWKEIKKNLNQPLPR